MKTVNIKEQFNLQIYLLYKVKYSILYKQTIIKLKISIMLLYIGARGLVGAVSVIRQRT